MSRHHVILALSISLIPALARADGNGGAGLTTAAADDVQLHGNITGDCNWENIKKQTPERQEKILNSGCKWTLSGIIPRTAGTEGGRNFRANWNGAASSS